MKYPVAFWFDDNPGVGIAVPDIPGLYSQAETIADIPAMVQEAATLMLMSYVEEGRAAPEPSSLEVLSKDPDYADCFWKLIDIDTQVDPLIFKACYPAKIERLEGNTWCVTFRDLPEIRAVVKDEEETTAAAFHALEEEIDAYAKAGKTFPAASPSQEGEVEFILSQRLIEKLKNMAWAALA